MLRKPFQKIKKTLINYSSKIARIGIRREDKNWYERRTPLTPRHVKRLVEDGLEVYVQPSSIRCFTDREYVKQGAKLSENLEEVDTIFALKEVPIEKLEENKTYCFFSHTIKGQPKNMQILKTCMEKNIRLIDYEKITNGDNKRLVRSGPFAGYAGVIDGLHILGERLLAQYGLSNPFNYLSLSKNYPDLTTARAAVLHVGEMIEQFGLPSLISPLTFCVTGGKGSVAQGAKQILELLPHRYIKPNELESFWENRQYASDRHIYIINVSSEDYIEKKDGELFTKEDYYQNPHLYKSNFHEKILPFTKVLINCVYWDWKYPKLMTMEQTQQLKKDEKLNLLFISDISCDVNGSIEIFKKTTSIDDPFYLMNVDTQKVQNSKIIGDGIIISGVDHLPAEFPVTSSEYFGDSLLKFVKNIAKSNMEKPLEEQGLLPEIERAVITSHGTLTPSHEYIFKVKEEYSLAGTSKILILGSGAVVPPIIDYLMRYEDYRVTLASADLERSIQLCEDYEGKANPVLLDVSDEQNVEELIASHDLILSMVPPPFHPKIAKLSIKNKKHFISASYISNEMKELNEEAKKENLMLLNEIGLDPGIDHMGIMKLLDDINSKNGKITEFKSFTGALPSPDASNNPLGYKFSWSPLGVINASQSPASFLYNGENIKIEGNKIMSIPKDVDLYPGFNFRVIPNRDSMKYQTFYNLQNHPLKTMMRGTIRYPGFCNMFMVFEAIGLFKDESINKTEKTLRISFPEFICQAAGINLYNDKNEFQYQLLNRNLLEEIVQSIIMKRNQAQLESNYVFQNFGKKSDQDIKIQAISAMEGFNKLGMLNKNEMLNIKKNQSHKEVMCDFLTKKLSYEKDENDLVFMHHSLTVSFDDESDKVYNSSLALYGDENYSATAATVGFPVAISARLLLEKQFEGITGVIAPYEHKQIYEKVLSELEKEGIRLVEEVSDKMEF